LKPNFSTEAEDQWDIIKFLENHPKWNEFLQTLTHEMEIQMNVEAQIPLPLNAQEGGIGEDGFQITASINELSDNPTEDNQDDDTPEDDGDAEADSSDSDNEDE